MKQIFLTVSTHIMATVPQIKLVDLDRGQLLLGNIPAEYPAVLVGVNYPTCEEVDDERMIYEVSVVLRVAFDDSAAETSSLTPGEWRDRSLSMLDTVDDLDDAMRLLESEQISVPTLRSITPEYLNGISVYTLSYTCYCERQ